MKFLDLLAGVPPAVATYFTRKAELKAQAHQNQVELLKAQGERQAQLASQGLTADAAWEQEFARQASSSWKDEFELIVISAPLMLCFLQNSWIDGPKIVKAGFDAISSTPHWFQFLVVSIYLANYGIRYWRKTQSDT